MVSEVDGGWCTAEGIPAGTKAKFLLWRWRSPQLTHLWFLEPSINLPEVFGEKLFSDGLSVDPNSLPDLDQMGRTRRQSPGFSMCGYTEMMGAKCTDQSIPDIHVLMHQTISDVSQNWRDRHNFGILVWILKY